MSIPSGARLGPYEVLSPLGAGGMGEVYRARDTRLDRDVAIKVLPDELARDRERILRFEREAKLLASLNHPNIAAIYGFEEHRLGAGATHFLVLEYVEGETLGDRLKRGALPVDEALDVCRQIAEGVEAAHEKGVIHRDLKPGNVMVKPDGTVKVLDFGLARAMGEEPSTSALADSPTITANYTKPGVVLGTAPYMSPEQARGRAVDKRTDIWSFGVILYECLTGRMLFRGESSTDTIGAILHKNVDLQRLPPDTPPFVRHVLGRCLERDKSKRLRDIGDVRIELEAALSGEPIDPALSSPTATGVSRRAVAVCLVATIALALATLGLAWAATRETADAPPALLNLSIAEDSVGHVAAPAHLHGPALAIAPDGSRVAFLGVERGQSKLFVRELSEDTSRSLPGTEGAVAPFFSPDGLRIGFMSRGMLRTIALDGAPPREVCPAPGLRGGCWTEGDEIVFAASMDSALLRVPSTGGVPRALTQLKREHGEVNHRFPEPLPGGRFVLFLIRRHAPDSSQSINYAIGVVDLETGDYRIVAEDLQHARYAGGLLVCSRRDGSIAGVPFDPEGLRTVGNPTTVLAGVRTNPLVGSSSFAIARNGTLAYLPGDAGALLARVVWIDREGTVTPALPTKRRYTVPRLSHDGRYLAVGIADPGPDIWRYDLRRDSPTRLRLTRDGSSIFSTWSPDDRWLSHGSGRTGTLQLYRIPSDGGGESQLIQSSEHSQVPTSWSSDGRMIAYLEHRPESGFDVWVKPLDADSTPWPVANESFDEMEPCFSPDSRWVAYTSTESGTEEVYVKAVNGKGARYPVSAGGGKNALWRGNEIFYLRNEELMVVEVTTEPEFSTGPPALVCTGFSHTFIPVRMYDVDSTGERIIATLPDAQSQRTFYEIRVVTGWADDVRRRLSDTSD